MLSQSYTGVRKLTSREHAIHLLIEKNQHMEKESVASLLLLDISGAFDYLLHERLIHNLQKRDLPTGITKWIMSFETVRLNSGSLKE
jgi:hypothetical protein